MEAVVGLLVMILGVSHGVATHCDGRQDGVQCFGPLGGTVVVQLMDSDSEISRYQLFYNNKTTLIRVGNNVIITNNIQDGSSFIPSDKTLTLNNLSRNDGGEYRLETFDKGGKTLGKRTLQLTIQAPVSSVLLDSECLSQGEKRVSCSSEGGESPQYSWTLDGHKLTDAELLSANTETNSITLKQHVSGLLLCSVSNDVSSVTTEEKISNCGFIYVNCTLNVTHISQWVFAANNTLCIEPTTAPTPTTEASTAGLETHCDGRQDGAQCFGPLGGTVVVQLMDSDSEISRYQLFYNNKTTLIRVANNVIITNKIQDRSSFTPSDKTLTLNSLSRNDGGEYRLETFDNDGKTSGERTLQLTIQAPVSSVLLDSECLSQGEKRVSCSSEGGESPQYSWTLDGHKLTDAELLSANTETNSITLKQHVSGLLLCSVSNDVSSVTTEENISDCGFIYINCTLNVTQISQWVFAETNTLCIEPTTAPTPTTEASLLICGVRAAVVIFVLIGISVYFAWKKNKYKMAEGSEDGQSASVL
ncbi:uncharacterized protein LOC115014832 isoform X2 [Cottoperca gobio]|uniref:Uncharacterized protein LOC115014832 isoform X1 n=1 Tax=Cottoperca gobio TaxID=56716 RepID=A0A6J2QJH3_COTGO|nr:uncharacterized protein LOC115014832 isoform X1 [Cottoperca gobio]XP_029297777.1 uncharacterized protein LOC115014832 isoform X2 [Cottoperca gobio]